MARRFVSDLGPQDNVDQVFLASQKQLRPNRNGNLYLQVDLTDRTGAITARMWNASETEYRSFEDGDLVRVEGATQIYQGGMQLIATRICKARSDEVDMADFMNLSPADIDKLAAAAGGVATVDARFAAAKFSRMFLDRRRFHESVGAIAGGDQEPSCVSWRFAGARGEFDGGG